ncbi:TIR domain-containing protein [Pseudoxanthomonas winnipegensis]|uniref:DNA-binding protein n=1 Tax=Pseudoxanthomonas winnipegensis TaxID=2480810 RepID=A0A4Q8LSD6_9GAMM|nr:nucleotide-binding protein [Pseudoxanthomonas winnipegensis]RZZ88370.1 DNA-binding protein [Pseudoxanthomonas winnipegensis]TAA34657.1 DNA-binding protein [Pseudoxanthomonas winnipegensis]
MFYHVIVETTEKVGKRGSNKKYFELDKADLNDVLERIVRPYLRKEDFQFDGYFLKYSEVRRIAVKRTEKSSQALSKYENDNIPAGVIMFVSPSDVISYERHAQDITVQVFDEARTTIAPKELPKSAANRDLSKVFIVHGRDDLAKADVARFVERLGFEAIILHEQASSGQTIIEKIEAHTNVGFAVVLYTPCDIGGFANEPQRPRARQNVVFEHGYLIGKLGRHNVSALVKGDVEIPNDISGVVYVPLDQTGAWRVALAKELRTAGYPVDMNRAV